MRYSLTQRKAAVSMLEELGLSFIERVVAKFKCCIRTAWRWWSLWDGSEESLKDKSFAPLTPNKFKHTQKEHDAMVSLLALFPGITLNELYGQLQLQLNYKRPYSSMYGYVRKHILSELYKADARSEYIPRPYNTPLMLGLKWQMDVKYVPAKCRQGNALIDKYYQYTIIDEATRERFIFAYKEHSGDSTCNFIKRAIYHFGYKPVLIQTDNGSEFVNPRTGPNATLKPHAVELLLLKLGIRYKQIPPATPRLNGKVERSHRKDQQWYDRFSFNDYDELNEKMTIHLKLSNAAPSRVLLDENKNWLSPLNKRINLTEELKKKMQTLGFSKITLQQAIYEYALNFTSGEYIPLTG